MAKSKRGGRVKYVPEMEVQSVWSVACVSLGIHSLIPYYGSDLLGLSQKFRGLWLSA